MIRSKISKFYTPKEVCEKFRISRATLSRYMKDKKINFVKLGAKNVRFSEYDLVQFVDSFSTSQTPPSIIPILS